MLVRQTVKYSYAMTSIIYLVHLAALSMAVSSHASTGVVIILR